MSILLDTGIFFAHYSLRDAYHGDAVAILIHALKGKWGKPLTSDYILSETLTLLKARASPERARAFLRSLRSRAVIDVIRLDDEGWHAALNLFEAYLAREGLSFTDAASLQIVREYAVDHIASFDTRSFRGLAKSLIGPGYWDSLPKTERNKVKRIAETLAKSVAGHTEARPP